MRGDEHGQRRSDRACRGEDRLERSLPAKPRRDGGAPPAALAQGDRELRARHLRAAATEAGRLILRLEAALVVEVAPIDVRWIDDDDIDRRIKAGDPVAALDALTFAVNELRVAAKWLEAHIALRGS